MVEASGTCTCHKSCSPMHAPLLNAMPCTTHHTLRPACMSDVDQHASYAAHVCIPMLTPVSRIQCTSMSTSTRHRRSIFYVTVAFDRHDTPTRPPGHPHQPHRHVAFTTTLSKRSSDGELGVGGGGDDRSCARLLSARACVGQHAYSEWRPPSLPPWLRHCPARDICTHSAPSIHVTSADSSLPQPTSAGRTPTLPLGL